MYLFSICENAESNFKIKKGATEVARHFGVSAAWYWQEPIRSSGCVWHSSSGNMYREYFWEICRKCLANYLRSQFQSLLADQMQPLKWLTFYSSTRNSRGLHGVKGEGFSYPDWNSTYEKLMDRINLYNSQAFSQKSTNE